MDVKLWAGGGRTGTVRVAGEVVAEGFSAMQDAGTLQAVKEKMMVSKFNQSNKTIVAMSSVCSV